MDGSRLIDVSTISSLKQIQYLYFNRNQITSLPSDIGKLNKTLAYLDMNNNKLTSLPKELPQMTHLKTLYIRSNDFTSTMLESIKDMFADNAWTRIYY
jgi:leucine-rich repeat protein SHOC2